MGLFDWLFSKVKDDPRDSIALTIKENLELRNYKLVQGVFNSPRDTLEIIEFEESQKNYLDNAISITSTPE